MSRVGRLACLVVMSALVGLPAVGRCQEPTPAKPAAEADIQKWALGIRARIASRLYAARTFDGRSHVVAEFFVDRDGRVSRLAIRESSGSAAVDGFVLHGIARMAPFAHLPASDESGGHLIRAPINFTDAPPRRKAPHH